MSQILLSAAAMALTGACVFAAGLWAFDRWAPARFVRERHDLALAIWVLVPVIFVIALQPRQVAPEVEYLPAGINAGIANPGGGAAEAAPAPMTAIVPEAARQIPWAPGLLAVWSAGALWGLISLGFDLMALARLKRGSSVVSRDELPVLSADVEIRRAPAIQSPMLAGYFRPVIYLPEAFALDRAARPVLEHEIAHLQRGDAWTVLALRSLAVAFWWAVPLRVVDRVLEQNRETLCDEIAARITGEPGALAHALLDTAARQSRRPALALAAGSGRSALASRVRRLASPEILNRRHTMMRLVYILPALTLAAMAVTPRVGAEIESGARVGEVGVERDLPLYQAARRGRISELEAMLEAGSDPNEISRGDGSPLFAAVRTGQSDVADLLLRYGADPNLAVRGDGSPMIEAARRGEVEIMRMMLAHGAVLDAGVRGDGNPLIAAVQRGERRAVEFLLEAGADPNAYVWADETPMIAAAQAGNIEIARLLAEAGADLSLTVLAPTRGGDVYRSPLSEAQRRGHRGMENWLQRWGAQHQPPAE